MHCYTRYRQIVIDHPCTGVVGIIIYKYSIVLPTPPPLPPPSLGVSSDDVVLSSTQVAVLPFLSRAAVVTEKLDGGNCSIYNGKVCNFDVQRTMTRNNTN